MRTQYVYEPETQNLGNLGWYLPDFYLPDLSTWVEVKPIPISWDIFRKLLATVLNTRDPLLLLIGPPDVRPYYALCPKDEDTIQIQKYKVTTQISVSVMRHTRFEFAETPTVERVRQMAHELRDTRLPSKSVSFQDDLAFELKGTEFKVTR